MLTPRTTNLTDVRGDDTSGERGGDCEDPCQLADKAAVGDGGDCGDMVAVVVAGDMVAGDESESEMVRRFCSLSGCGRAGCNATAAADNSSSSADWCAGVWAGVVTVMLSVLCSVGVGTAVVSTELDDE